VNRHPRILPAIDAVLTALVVALVLGSALCFGGVVWWFRPAFALLAFALSVAMLLRLLLERRLPILKSPLTLLAFLAMGLGLLQIVPLPASLAHRLSPQAQEIYSLGVKPDLARADSPSVELGEPAHIRSPATLDRSATLRWVFGSLACFAVFWAVSHFADRLKRLYLVWGCVLAAFLLNGALDLVQIAGGVEGLFGSYRPGAAPVWAPSNIDLLESPSSSSLRPLSDAFPSPGGAPAQPAVLVPEEPVLLGTMMASTGAFLAFGSLALPMGLAIILHTLSARGSRETLSTRLSHHGHGSLIVLLSILLVSSAFLVGMASGPMFCVPFLVGVAAVGLTSVPRSRGWAIGLMALLLASVGLGAASSALWPVVVGGPPPVASVSWERAQILWTDSLAIFRSFPIIGTGFGSFSAIHPYVKTSDPSSTTAMSSLLQWAAESGVIGLTLLIAAMLWVLYRLPGVIKRVGSADRTLAYGLIGAAIGFSLWSVVHWTVELPAVAISASALGGTWNRWLAGGTDLFVDRA
jgi:hypothetical protein